MPKLPPITVNTNNRHLQGTTNYIAEYLLMLFSLVGLATSLILMVFSVCTMLKAGDSAGLSTASGMSAVVVFLVFGPIYYALSSRVRAQESKQPEIVKHKARTVFYVLASISAFSWFTGFVAAALYYLLSPLGIRGESYGDNAVTVLIPSVIAAVVVALAYASIAKSAGTRYVAKFSSLILLAGLVLAIATVSVAIAKKDSRPSLKSGEQCTYSNYSKQKCTYDEYQDYLDDSSSSRYRTPTYDYDIYDQNVDTNTLEDFYNY
jgi:hypothetical protein